MDIENTGGTAQHPDTEFGLKNAAASYASEEAGVPENGSPGLPERDQIRLSRLSVFNWGSFSGLHTVTIDGAGTLITGENGAGKSTMIDGLMILLSSAGKAQFNIAASQGDRSDRSLVSYMRGNYGSTSDEEGTYARAMREDSTVSVLEAVYEHTMKDEKVVLLAVFYLPGKTTALADVKKLYAVAEEEIPVPDIIREFSQSDSRALKTYLKRFRGIRICDDSFTEYLTCLKHRLNIQNDNAPALLSRALGLKKIDNLTSLIRTLVLEPCDVAEDVRNALRQFDDLGRTHDRLVDARNQQAALRDLPGECQTMESLAGEKTVLQGVTREIPAFVAGFGVSFYEARLVQIDLDIRKYEDMHARLRTRRDNAQQEFIDYSSKYSNAGGSSISGIEQKLQEENSKREQISGNCRKYRSLAEFLDLGMPESAEDFYRNQEALAALRKNQDEKDESLADRLGEISGNSKALSARKSDIEKELRDLEKHPESNVDIRYIRFRDEMVRDLGIPASRLVFLAELMEVRESQKEWRGAIERAIGSMRQILLVSRESYRTITAWVNGRHNNIHVKLQVADGMVRADDDFAPDGFLSKLNWKDHPYTDWLRSFLKGHDLTCVDNVEQLNDTEFSITREGLIHRREGFFEKNDRSEINDPRNWYLGFSNRERLDMLRSDLAALEKELNRLTASRARIKAERENIRLVLKKISDLEAFDSYAAIDLGSLEEIIRGLEKRRDEILGNQDLQHFRQLMEDARLLLESINKEISDVDYQLRTSQESRKRSEASLAAFREAWKEVSGEAIGILRKKMKKLDLTADNVFEDKSVRLIQEDLNSDQVLLEQRFNAAKLRISRIMTAFKSKEAWTYITAEWSTDPDPDNISLYLRHLEKIEKEGLPALVEEFREKLNTETSQSVFVIQSKINSEIQNIDNRIMKINRVLSKAEFRQNSFLKIIPEKNRESPAVERFNRALRRVGSLITDENNERRFESLRALMEILNNAVTHDKQFENRQLLDPRLRREFVAQEIDRRNGQVRDVLKSSSGKSGGEKEAFAGAVVAASLAYVLTPDNADVPSYCTVFLDEAFSNTSDRVSERVLRIFRELRLHINLITPFKNIDIARNYARSLLVMTRNEDTNESAVHELTWEEYEDQQRKRQEDAENQASSFGISATELSGNADSGDAGR
ncbi:ATP-binding protein [Succinimonas amylolytica]|uniref:ATP-binding protein n=1 Tax=Succinimonas amylolytica TaxID=83769 RepID=UPI0023A8D0D1